MRRAACGRTEGRRTNERRARGRERELAGHRIVRSHDLEVDLNAKASQATYGLIAVRLGFGCKYYNNYRHTYSYDDTDLCSF